MCPVHFTKTVADSVDDDDNVDDFVDLSQFTPKHAPCPEESYA